MTREEQITNAFWNSVIRPNDAIYRASFEAGAKWADAHPKEDGVEMWIARDEDTSLYLFIDGKPKLKGTIYIDCPKEEQGTWFPINDWGAIDIPPHLFPNVTFDNSPMKVRLTLVKGGE